jgi:hypothetical protein
MPRKTIYLSEEDAKVWQKAAPVIRFNHNVGLGAFLTPFLKQILLWEPQPDKPRKRIAKKK